MITAGIIAEYNPFHNGHAYQIRKARALGATHIVAVMGGSFTQRGECAAFDKHTRAHAALMGGANLVIELPLPYAVSSAERFAYGGVSLLDALGCVDWLVFGSECADCGLLTRAARAMDKPDFSAALRRELDRGLAFPKARQLALAQTAGDACAGVLSEPNNILGVEYIKWLLRHNSPITPVTVMRTGAAHESDRARDGIASASLIRKKMLSGGAWQEFVPPDAAALYTQKLREGSAPCSLLQMERAVLCRMRTITREELLAIPDVTEGLEGRILRAARNATSLEELYLLIKTKRYTLSRIRRIVLCAFLGVTAPLQLAPPPYLRVLGFDGHGRELLARAKKTARLPLRTSLARCAQINGQAALPAALEGAAGDLFALCSPQILACGLDFTSKAVIIE